MIPRNLAPTLSRLAGYYPVVTVTGPRQAGKTTLCRATFPDKPYVSLEPLDARGFAAADPRGFLAQFPDGAILDEVQHAPGLLSYIQTRVDEHPAAGQFILIGSQHFGLTTTVSQTLAGRTGVLYLLPLGLDELRRFPDAPLTLLETLVQGGYPRIPDIGIPAGRWLADYVTTYVERDVRSVLGVADLLAFGEFLKLCAGRSGQFLNYSDLGVDAGVSHNTAKAWLSVLEASFICFRLPAWHVNVSKQVAKTAKLHFFDTGLVCHLLGIRSGEELAFHPLRGAVFETWVASEVYKARAHQGLGPALFHLRRPRGEEVDLVVDSPDALHLVEAKSGATIVDAYFGTLAKAATTMAQAAGTRSIVRSVVYGGDLAQDRHGARVIPWHQVPGSGWGE